MVVAQVETAVEAIQTAKREEPDVCLLDIDMPGNGIWAAGKITRLVPDTVVVMLTVADDDENLIDALLAGATGYLIKDLDPDSLPRTVRAAAMGEATLPRSLTGRLLTEFRIREGRRRAVDTGNGRVELTPREWEVLQMMAEGISTAAIADRLFVEAGTIRSHISALLKKLDVVDRAAAVRVIKGR